MTTTAVLISAQILSRRDNWGLFSSSLAVWNNSFGQLVRLLSKMPAKHSQRQEKRPSAQTKTLISSLLGTSGAPLDSNWAPAVGSWGNAVPAVSPELPVTGEHCLPLEIMENHPQTVCISSILLPVTLQIPYPLYQAETAEITQKMGEGQQPLHPLQGKRCLLQQ